MLMAAKPYVGMTGPADIEETKAVVKGFKDAGYTM
jgi:hypothetical protein